MVGVAFGCAWKGFELLKWELYWYYVMYIFIRASEAERASGSEKEQERKHAKALHGER